jgi:hypothetical protein
VAERWRHSEDKLNVSGVKLSLGMCDSGSIDYSVGETISVGLEIQNPI